MTTGFSEGIATGPLRVPTSPLASDTLGPSSVRVSPQHRKNMFPKRTLIGAALAATLASSASATVLVSEDFEYGSTAGNLQTITSSAYTTGNVDYSTTSLVYSGSPALGSAGGSINFGPSDTITAGAFDPDGAGPDIAGGTVSNGTYWYSFIFTPVDSTVTGSGARGTFNVFSSTTSTNGQNGVGFRIDAGTTTADIQFKALGLGGGGTANASMVTNGYGQTYFIVGRATFTDTTVTNRIWVNPSTNSTVLPLDTDTNSASISSTLTERANARSNIVGRMFGTGAGSQMLYDRVMVGTTFADVAASPVPEPSSFAALAGLGALGFVASRRRRQA